MTTSGNRSSTTKTNSLGEVIESTDNGNNTVLTSYYASGLPRQISIDGAQFSTTITYDVYGNRTSISDPDAGTITSEYNALGYLITSTDNDGNVTTNTYDKSGRLLTSVLDNVTTTYTYDSQIIGQISSVANGNSSIIYDYDDLGRMESQEETLVETGGNKSVTQSFTYDEYGRLETKAWSGGYGITFDYNNFGYLYRIRDENYTLWNATAQNAYGQYTAYNQGSHGTNVTYNTYGELNQMVTPGVRNMEYSFNRLGNLVLRKDNLSNQKEVFDYDDLDRLTGIEYYLNNILQTAENKTVYYDSYGNITGKTGIAACDSIIYGENGYGPHALTTIWHPGDYLPPDQQISYTPFNKVLSISDTLSGSIVRHLGITYGYDKQRRRSVYTDGTIARTKYFFGDYEEHIDGSSTTKYFFVNSPTGLCGVYVIEGSNPGQLYYSFTDHLGSFTEMVDAATGTNIIRQSFDAWGNPRSVSDWTSPASYQLFADRGFTGHEHLEEFSLINMNGRVYDPMLGRFLSPDPYIQLPDFSQSFNRYTYCLNNPLKYTDPDGESIIGAILIGAFINNFIQTLSGNVDSFGDWALSLAVGGLSGAAGFGAGQLISGALGASTTLGGSVLKGALTGTVGGFAGGFVGGAGNAWAGGASFSQGLNSGIRTGTYGALTGGVVGGITGGIQYGKQMSSFRKGNADLGIKSGDPIPATDDFLSRSQEAWYPDAPMENVGKFTVENVPSNHQAVLDANGAAARTVALSKGEVFTGNSNVYFNKNLAFTSAKRLFFTMGHELIHVSQFASLAGLSTDIVSVRLLDFHAYSYEYNVLGSGNYGGFTPSDARQLMLQYPNYFQSLHYMNFPWTTRANFIYPF